MAAIVRTMTAIGSAITAIVSALHAIARAMHAILHAIVEMARAMRALAPTVPAMRAMLCAMRAIVNAMPQWPQCAMQCTLISGVLTPSKKNCWPLTIYFLDKNSFFCRCLVFVSRRVRNFTTDIIFIEFPLSFFMTRSRRNYENHVLITRKSNNRITIQSILLPCQWKYWHRAKNRHRDKTGFGMYNPQNVEKSGFGQSVCVSVCLSVRPSVCLSV